MHTQFLTVAVLSSLTVTLTCKAADNQAAAIGSPAPAFTLEDQSGKAVSLSDYRGKIVVLQWWNEGCPYVVRHAKAATVNGIVDKYRDRGVVVLGVNSTSSSTNASNKKAADQFKLEYPLLNDAKGTVGKNYGAKTTPHMYVIDASGKLAYSGAIDDDPDGIKPDRSNYVVKAVDELLAGAAVSTAETKPYGCSVKYGG